MTVIAGWSISVEAQARPSGGAVYDDPGTVYDLARYDSVGGFGQWEKIDCQVLSVSCTRGTDAPRGPHVIAEAGTLTARLYDPERLLDPAYTKGSVFAEAGAPVRVVATPAAATADGARYDDPEARYDTDDVYGEESFTVVVWSGTADSWDHDLLDGSGTLTAVDVIDRLAGTDVADFRRPDENTVDRLGALLGSLGGQAPQTQYRGSGKSLRAANLSGDVRSILGKVLETDMSWLWPTADGSLVWMARDALLPKPHVLVDCDDGSSIVYTQMSTDVGRQRIVNEVNAQRVADDAEERPTSRKYTSQDSISRFGPRQYSANDLQVFTDEQVDWWAQELLDLRSYPQPALSSIGVEVQDVLPWAVRCLTMLLGVDVGDPLQVALGSRGDPQIFGTIVTGVRHDIAPGVWFTGLDVAPYTSSWGVMPGVPPDVPPTSAAGTYDDPSSTYDGTTVYDAALAATGRW